MSVFIQEKAQNHTMNKIIQFGPIFSL